MIKRHGDFEYGCGARSWRVNGVLCSLWIEANRLKIYQYDDKGKCYAASYELGDKADNKRARRAVQLLSDNNKVSDGVSRSDD